jgi:hypothetical protein
MPDPFGERRTQWGRRIARRERINRAQDIAGSSDEKFARRIRASAWLAVRGGRTNGWLKTHPWPVSIPTGAISAVAIGLAGGNWPVVFIAITLTLRACLWWYARTGQWPNLEP